MANLVSGRGSEAMVAPLVAIIEKPRKYSMPARVTMKDDTPTLVTQKPCQAPISMPTTIAAGTAMKRRDVVAAGQHRHDHADEGHRRSDREIEVARDDQHHGADRRQG